MDLLNFEFETEEEELKLLAKEEEKRSRDLAQSRGEMARTRDADASNVCPEGRDRNGGE
jgi:hypothetical protein